MYYKPFSVQQVHRSGWKGYRSGDNQGTVTRRVDLLRGPLWSSVGPTTATRHSRSGRTPASRAVERLERATPSDPGPGDSSSLCRAGEPPQGDVQDSSDSRTKLEGQAAGGDGGPVTWPERSSQPGENETRANDIVSDRPGAHQDPTARPEDGGRGGQQPAALVTASGEPLQGIHH